MFVYWSIDVITNVGSVGIIWDKAQANNLGTIKNEFNDEVLIKIRLKSRFTILMFKFCPTKKVANANNF